jgi:nicotinamide mononucleotide transporter
MAKRKIENWILWIIADAISIPLYFYKGLTFSSFQFILFTIIAILGYKEWKRFLQKTI